MLIRLIHLNIFFLYIKFHLILFWVVLIIFVDCIKWMCLCGWFINLNLHEYLIYLILFSGSTTFLCVFFLILVIDRLKLNRHKQSPFSLVSLLRESICTLVRNLVHQCHCSLFYTHSRWTWTTYPYLILGFFYVGTLCVWCWIESYLEICVPNLCGFATA